MSKLKTVTNVALYTAGEIIPRVLSFLLLPVLTRYLTTSDYGISSYINTTLTFLYVLTTLSVNTYTLRSYYNYTTESEKKKLLGNIFVFLVGWGFIMLCLEALLLPFLLNAFSVNVPFYPYFLLGLIINFFDVIAVIPLVAYRVNENAKGFVMLSVGRTLLQYILILIFVAYFKMGLFGSFLGRLAACFPFCIIYILVIKNKGTFYFNMTQIKKALHFSLPLLPGVLSYLIISIFDRIILERYVSLSDLGLYSVAATLALTLNIIIQGIYRSFEQQIFREHAHKYFMEFADKLFKIFIAALYIPGFAMVLFARETLLFFTSSQYLPAEKYVVYLVVAVIISGINTFLTTLLIANNSRKVITYTFLAAAGISFIANLLFIKYFGVLGACIASIISFLIIYIFYYKKVVLKHTYIIQQIVFAVIFFASAYFMPANLPLAVIILIKMLLLLVFLFFVKTVMNIRLPRLSSLRSFKTS
jgi:O-antigen/teichoic acid export membrane protein